MEAQQNFEVTPLTDEQIKEQIEPIPTNNPNDGDQVLFADFME